MKIATWNVNSVKARTEHLIKWLGEFQPDVVCLQELKGIEETFPALEVKGAGYDFAVSGQKTYNGVAILTKHPFEVTETRLPGEEEDEQARYIEAVINDDVRVASIYLPNGNPIGTEKFDYKLRWMERLYTHAQGLLESEQPVVLAGDYNVIPADGDCYSPKAFAEDALFQPESQAAFRKILHLGYTEAYRSLHGEVGQFSWWGYQGGGWQKDHGVRIDHLLLSPQAADRLTACDIDRTPRGWEKPSDHTPVWIELSE